MSCVTVSFKVLDILKTFMVFLQAKVFIILVEQSF